MSRTAPLALGSTSERRGLAWRRFADIAFEVIALVVLLVALACLGALIWDILSDGAGRLSLDFITGFPSRRASQAGIWPALTGSIFIILVTAVLAVPVGVAAAIYLEEYGGRSLAARLIGPLQKEPGALARSTTLALAQADLTAESLAQESRDLLSQGVLQHHRCDAGRGDGSTIQLGAIASEQTHRDHRLVNRSSHLASHHSPDAKLRDDAVDRPAAALDVTNCVA